MIRLVPKTITNQNIPRTNRQSFPSVTLDLNIFLYGPRAPDTARLPAPLWQRLKLMESRRYACRCVMTR